MAEKDTKAPPVLLRKSYADQVYQYIRDLILSGDLKQGDKIVEEKIAQQFGVSRTPIREALTRLQVAGLVRLKPRSYVEVARIKQEEVADIAELRLNLERMAFRKMCENFSPTYVEQLQTVANDAREALLKRDKAAYFELDSRFHTLATKLSGNGELHAVYSHFAGKIQLLRIAQEVPMDRLEIYMRQHFDLIEMLADQRAGAIDELLRIHIVHDIHH
jgi:DNA-binding GntR family transcriptional regulator